MDSEHWISRLAAAKRYYAAQLGHVDGEDVPAFFSCFSLHSVTSREAIRPGTDLRVLCWWVGCRCARDGDGGGGDGDGDGGRRRHGDGDGDGDGAGARGRDVAGGCLPLLLRGP